MPEFYMTAIALDTYVIRNGHHPLNINTLRDTYADTYAATGYCQKMDSREEQRWGLLANELVSKENQQSLPPLWPNQNASGHNTNIRLGSIYTALL